MYKAEIETFCMNILDVEILMAYLNEETFLGFSQKKKIVQSDVILGIYHLAKKKIIDIQNDTICICEKYQEIIDCIRNAHSVLILEPTDKKYKKKCCYIGEDVLVSELSDVRKNEMIVYHVEKERLCELLLEEEYFFGQKRKREELFKEDDEEKIVADDLEKYCAEIDVYLKMYLHKNGKCSEKIYLTDEGLDEYIYRYKENEKEIVRQIYSKENISKLIQTMMV